MPWVVREAVRDINRAVGRRWHAIDPLLPDPATLPAGCGEPLVVTGENGRLAGLGVCVHQHIPPQSLNQTWGAADRFTLVPRLAGPDVAAPADLLLAQWRDHLSGIGPTGAHQFWAEQLGGRPISLMEVGGASGQLAKASAAYERARQGNLRGKIALRVA